MYSAVHGSIGIVAGLPTYTGVMNLTNNFWLALGVSCFVSFLLHDPTDRLGEHGLGKYFLVWELIPFAIIMFLGLRAELFWLYLAWYISGNGMDIWDKIMYLAILFPKKFKMRYDFPCHRRLPNIVLGLTVTRWSQFASIVVVFLMNYI